VTVVVLNGVMVTVKAIRSKVRWFKLGQGQWIFKSDENAWHYFFGREVKP
jgi:hypothetical protein